MPAFRKYKATLSMISEAAEGGIQLGSVNRQLFTETKGESSESTSTSTNAMNRTSSIVSTASTTIQSPIKPKLNVHTAAPSVRSISSVIARYIGTWEGPYAGLPILERYKINHIFTIVVSIVCMLLVINQSSVPLRYIIGTSSVLHRYNIGIHDLCLCCLFIVVVSTCDITFTCGAGLSEAAVGTCSIISFHGCNKFNFVHFFEDEIIVNNVKIIRTEFSEAEKEADIESKFNTTKIFKSLDYDTVEHQNWTCKELLQLQVIQIIIV